LARLSVSAVFLGMFLICLILPVQPGHAQPDVRMAAITQNVLDESSIGLQPPSSTKHAAPSEALLKLLEERQLDLDRREAAVRRDEERLRLLRLDIEELLKKHEKQAKGNTSSAKAGSGPQVVQLGQVFESMPVEEAAQRLDKMSDAVALDLMSRLKSKTAGQILAAMNPTRAARLVEKLAADRQRVSGNSESPSERK
jgi:flagellar motility protein MotE (MotC chaperone)